MPLIQHTERLRLAIHSYGMIHSQAWGGGKGWGGGNSRAACTGDARKGCLGLQLGVNIKGVQTVENIGCMQGVLAISP